MAEHSHHRDADTRRLRIALVLTGSYFLVELAGGLLSNSLALLSDAGHMLSDVAALCLSLFAFHISRRPADPKRTYGYHRVEILAALLNGLALWLIVGVIFHEAFHRLFEPPEVQSLGMLLVAAVGLLVNVGAAFILNAGGTTSLNLRGAWLHVLGDALGSVGAICAGVIMVWTNWYLADPLVGMMIGSLILYTSWGLIRDSVEILMQAVPSDLSLDHIKATMESIDGVHRVHDLHVWTVTSGIYTLTAHAVTDPASSPERILNDIETHLRDRFQIHHTTVQLETEDREPAEFQDF